MVDTACTACLEDLAPVYEAEAAERRLLVALASAPCEVAHRRTDTARLQEAECECAARHDGQLGAELRADVGCGADLVAELVDRLGEALALFTELAADLLFARFSGGHSSAPPSSASLLRSPGPARAARPSGRG